MKLAEAIKTTENYINFTETEVAPDRIPAFKLLIEAGKRIIQQRHYNLTFQDELLPGETEGKEGP